MRLSTLIIVVLGFCVGVGWQTVSELPLSMSVWFLVLAFGIAVVWRRKSVLVSPTQESSLSMTTLLYSSLFLCFLSLGIVRTEVASWQFDSSPLESSLGESVTLEGVIAREPEYKERTVQLYVRTETDTVLVTTDRLSKLSYGDRVIVAGKLQRPDAFETDLGRSFDYPGYLRARGVEYRISFAEVQTVDSGEGNPIIASLLFAKSAFINSIQRIIPEPAVGLGSGLLLGVKSALGADIEADFRRTGIIHIVVLSGYNVMLVVAFIMFCFSFFLSLRMRVVAGIVAIIAFALIVGLSATVVRASIMAVFVLLAQVLGRRYDVLRGLLLAGVVMLLINPYLLIYDVGFQLSFMATLGLVLIVPQLEEMMFAQNKLLGIKEFFLATVSTQIAVLPLLMYHIGEISVISVVVNILVLPIVPVAMLLTFLTGLLGFFSLPLGSLVGYLATLTLKYILVVAKWFGSLSFAAVPVPPFSALGMFLLYGCLLLVGVFFVSRKKQLDQLETAKWTIEEEQGRAVAAEADLPIFFR